MLALLVFAYACCGIGVWFGWYLRGRRTERAAEMHTRAARQLADGARRIGDMALGFHSNGTLIVYGDSFAEDSPRNHAARSAAIVADAQDSTE